MKSGIYKLEWPSGYFYYGQAQDLDKRRQVHLFKIRGKYHDNKFIQRVCDKYGEPKFVIMEFCRIGSLDKKEQKYLDLHFKNKKCCNQSPTASSCRGIKRSEATKEKLRQFRAGKFKGKENPNYGNRGKKNPIFGIVRSARTRKLMGDSQLGELNCMYGRKGKDSISSKIVLNTETGIFYECVREAAETISFYPQGLARKLRGEWRNRTPFIYA
jgi:group I intron endonuclease